MPTDCTPQVTDYLLKKGFTKTEATFRKESSNVNSDGRPIRKKIDEMGPERYPKAFQLLKDWIENGLDLYKVRKAQLATPCACRECRVFIQHGSNVLIVSLIV